MYKKFAFQGGALINKVVGNVSVNIVDSTVAEIFHNGGTYIGGDCNIRLTNSNVVSNYFYGSSSTKLSSTNDWVKERGINGNLNIILEGTTKVNYDIYATRGDVKGSVNVVITDSASVGGKIYGGDGNAAEKVLYVGTDSKSYTGTISVADFNKIEISADSKVVFSDAFDVDTLIVEVPTITLFSTDAQVTLAEGTKFDTLTLVGDFAETENSVSLDSIFGDSTGVVLSAMEDENASFTVVDSNGQEWTTENVSLDGNKVSFDLGTAVPEPSTYAIIFGAIALGFVAYRRRK